MDNITALDLVFDEAKFTLVRQRKHKVWHCPCGHHSITSSGSHHEGRGYQNAEALLARIQRECAACEKCAEKRREEERKNEQPEPRAVVRRHGRRPRRTDRR